MQKQPENRAAIVVTTNTTNRRSTIASSRTQYRILCVSLSLDPHLSEHVIRNLERVLHRRVCRDDLQQLVVVHHDEGVHGLFQLRDSLPNTDTLPKPTPHIIIK